MKFKFLFVACLLMNCGIARAQAPLQLHPTLPPLPPALKPGGQQKIGAWTATIYKDDVSDELKRIALSESKTRPLQHGNPIRGVLAARCGYVISKPGRAPQLLMLMYGISRVGHRKHYLVRFRIDEKEVHSFNATLTTSEDGFFFSEDVADEIIDSKRMRLEVSFPRQPQALFDFDITGSTAAITWLACN